MYGSGEITTYAQGAFTPEVDVQKMAGYDYDYSGDNPNASLTDTCYRLPVRPGDGFGPSEYGDSQVPGFDWLWPAAQVGTAKALDENKVEVALVCDAKTQRAYHINRPDILQDRVGAEYAVGKDIWSEVWLRSVYARPGEHVAIKHTESHFYFDPDDRSRRNTTGFDALGFMENFSVDAFLLANGEPDTVAAQAETLTVPIGPEGEPADVVFDDESEGKELQLRLRMRAAGYKLKGIQGQYDTIDKAARPDLRQMTETQRQDRLAGSPLFRCARGDTPTLNLATGAVATGAVEAAIAGPDGQEDTGMQFSAANPGLSDAMPESLSGDFSLIAWTILVGGELLPLRLWDIGDLHVEIDDIGDRLQVRITDGINSAMVANLSQSFGSWGLITVVRRGMYVDVYENTTFLGSFHLTSSEDYGTAVACANNTASGLYDPTVVPSALEAGDVAYYYNDVVNRNGKATQPVW